MELVRNYLRNKGLQSVLSELDAVSKDDPIEGSVGGEMIEIQNTLSTSSRFKNEWIESLEMSSVRNCISEYLRLRHWVISSLDILRGELFTLCYPIFEHIYTAMIRCNAFHEASIFMTNWGEDYWSNEATKEDIVKLASMLSTNGMKLKRFSSEDCLDNRHERIQMKVNPRAYGLFMKFLNDNNMFIVMTVINDEVLYLMDDGKYNLQNVSTTAFAGKMRLFDQCDDNGNGDENVYTGVFGVGTRDLSPTVFHKDSIGLDTGSCSIFYSEIFEKSLKRRQILDQCLDIVRTPSSIVWPSNHRLRNCPSFESLHGRVDLSLLYSTMTNSYENISCMDIGGLSGSHIVCGFQDGCIRTWSDSVEKSHSRSTSYSNNDNNLFVSPKLKQNQVISKGHYSWNGIQNKVIGLNPSEIKHIELRGHERTIYSICQDKSGVHMLSASGDGTVRLWNMETFKCVAKYNSFGPSWNVDISPWGHYFAVSNQNSSSLLYSFEYGTPLRIFVGHNSDVNSCKFHPNESYLLTGSDDCSARIWDIRGGASVQIYRNAPAPISVIAVCGSGNNFAVGCKNGNILLYDISAGKRMALFDGHDGCVNSLSFSPNGHLLCSGAADDSICLWNVHNVSAHRDDVSIASDNCRFHTKFSSISSINFATDHLIYAGGIFTFGRPQRDERHFKHNVRDHVIDVTHDFGLTGVK